MNVFFDRLLIVYENDNEGLKKNIFIIYPFCINQKEYNIPAVNTKGLAIRQVY